MNRLLNKGNTDEGHVLAGPSGVNKFIYWKSFFFLTILLRYIWHEKCMYLRYTIILIQVISHIDTYIIKRSLKSS